MTALLLDTIKTNLKEFSLAPYSDGRFEVFVDGKNVYSKKETGKFPDEKELVQKIKAMIR